MFIFNPSFDAAVAARLLALRYRIHFTLSPVEGYLCRHLFEQFVVARARCAPKKDRYVVCAGWLAGWHTIASSLVNAK